MLLSLRIENFKSFNEPVVIDCRASKSEILKDTNVYNGVLKGLMFVGGNGTGKTNSILAIGLLLDLLFVNIDVRPYICLFSGKNALRLGYTFKFDDDIVEYNFTILTSGEIQEEVLTLNGESKLNRVGLSAKSNIGAEKIFNSDDIDANSLFVKKLFFYDKFTAEPVLRRWFEFIQNSVYLNTVASTILSHNLEKLDILGYLESGGVSNINKFLKDYGFNTEVAYETARRASKYATFDFGQEKHVFMKRNGVDMWLPLPMESLGNQTFINMLPSVLHAISHECMLIVDEFSSAFHNELEEFIVKFFMKNAERSQMFFVSHSTNLLKTSLLRPDQIYIAEFEDSKGTTLCKASEEHPRESQNLEKLYLGGVFGGIPRYRCDKWGNKDVEK